MRTALAVTATPLRKSRRVILRFIPSSRSVRSFMMGPCSGVLHLALGLLDCQLCALEADAAVCAVAKWLVHRAAAAAERKGGLAGEVIRGAVDVDELHRSLRRFDAIWAVGTNCDLYLCHDGFLQPYEFLVRLKR